MSTADPIKRSRRANLSFGERVLIHWLPRSVYRQILREHDLGKAALLRLQLLHADSEQHDDRDGGA